MLQEAQIGRGDARPERCAISGRVLEPEDVYMPINGVIIGIKAREWRDLTPEAKADWRAEWQNQFTADAPPSPMTSRRGGAPTPTQPADVAKDIKTIGE